MAKRTYLELTNLILKRIGQSTVATLSGLTAGTFADLITDYLNDAQNVLLLETNWYTLLTTETFTTSSGTNTHDLPSDYASTLTLKDTTHDLVLDEDVTKEFDYLDPDESETGNPTRFAAFSADDSNLTAGQLQLYPTPDGSYNMTHRYFRVPNSLSGDSDTSVLPLFCEPLLIKWVEVEVWSGLKKDQVRATSLQLIYNDLIKKALMRNDEVINRLRVVDSMSRKARASLRPRLKTPIV